MGGVEVDHGKVVVEDERTREEWMKERGMPSPEECEGRIREH